MSVYSIAGRSAASVLAFVLTILIGAAFSEVILGRAGAIATSLILALLIPVLLGIWCRTSALSRIGGVALGWIAGAMVWALGHAFEDPWLVGTLTSAACLVSGLIAFVAIHPKRAEGLWHTAAPGVRPVRLPLKKP